MTKMVKTKGHGKIELWQMVGRLPKFESPEQLQSLFKKYFKDTPFFEYSVTGLALACGTSRKYLCVYQEKPEYKDLITQAKTIIEHSYEMSLRKNGRTTDIFALKQFGWQDVVVNENKHSGEIATGINWIDTTPRPKAIDVTPAPQVLLPGEETDDKG